jgi:carboxyl-terminal processing protease
LENQNSVYQQPKDQQHVPQQQVGYHVLNHLQSYISTRVPSSIRIIAVIISMCMGLISFAPSGLYAQSPDRTTDQVRELLVNYHISGVTHEELQGKSIENMLAYINDPYTDYFNAEASARFYNSIEQNYVGLGIRIEKADNGFFITGVIENSPASMAGLQKGDQIQEVNGVRISTNDSIDQMFKRLKGELGDSMNLFIRRQNQIIFYDLVISAFNYPDIYSYWFEPGVGYIQITSFSSDIGDQFDRVIADFQSKGLTSLIIDLRNNSGGFSESATHIFSRFVNKGVVYYSSAKDQTKKPQRVNVNQPNLQVPVTMILNAYSASASELLTGALQDYRIARVVGKKSFGKGIAQQLFPLEGGTMLKITTEEYFTPQKIKVNQVGIQPDVDITGDLAQFLTALRMAGIPSLTLNVSAYELLVNGISLNEDIDIITQDGEIYVPSRVLAALIGAQITWNEQRRSVDIARPSHKASFLIDADHLKVIQGVSYIQLKYFSQFFPEFSYKQEEHQFTMVATERK